MGIRILTATFGLVLGAWFYAEEKQIDLYSEGIYDVLHSLAFVLGFFLAAVLVGCVVGRWWVVLALIGPLLSLGYLQVTGYVSPWHDGVSPLSLPTIVGMTWVAVLLLLGVGLRAGWDWLHSARRETFT